MDRRALVERADHEVLVQHFDIRIRLDHAGGYFARFVRFEHHALAVGRVRTQFQILDVQDDVDDVFTHARDRRELVLHAFDLDAGDSGALQRAEQDAAQGHTERNPEATLERLGHHGSAAGVAGDRLDVELGWLDQVFPVFIE